MSDEVKQHFKLQSWKQFFVTLAKTFGILWICARNIKVLSRSRLKGAYCEPCAKNLMFLAWKLENLWMNTLQERYSHCQQDDCTWRKTDWSGHDCREDSESLTSRFYYVVCSIEESNDLKKKSSKSHVCDVCSSHNPIAA